MNDVGYFGQGTVGHAIGGVKVRIVDEGEGGKYADVAPGQSGELWIAGPTVFDQCVAPRP